MNPIQERLKAYISYLQVSVRSFESACGLSYGYIGNMRQSIQPDKISSIAQQYPQLNLGWVLTGEGQMLKFNSQTEGLADRLSEIIIDMKDETLDNIGKSLGVSDEELSQFTNNFIFPNTPFRFDIFLSMYPEYNLQWIITGEGRKFKNDEEQSLKNISDKIYRKNHPEFFQNKANQPVQVSDSFDDRLWNQVAFQNEQLKEKDAQIREKDAQINKLLDALPKK